MGGNTGSQGESPRLPLLLRREANNLARALDLYAPGAVEVIPERLPLVRREKSSEQARAERKPWPRRPNELWRRLNQHAHA